MLLCTPRCPQEILLSSRASARRGEVRNEPPRFQPSLKERDADCCRHQSLRDCVTLSSL